MYEDSETSRPAVEAQSYAEGHFLFFFYSHFYGYKLFTEIHFLQNGKVNRIQEDCVTTIKKMERCITVLLWCLLQGVGGQILNVARVVKCLEGSCVRIPCSFTLTNSLYPSLDRTCKVQWFRDRWGSLMFDSSLPGHLNVLQGELVGNLLEGDCTIIFHNVPIGQSSYYFRLECDNVLKYTFNRGVTINVKDNWIPVLSPKGKIEVQEGSPVRLSCSAIITCPLLPPMLSWRPSLGDAREEVGAEVVTSVLIFNASSLHHKERIFCSSLYKRQAGHSNISFEKHLTINVLCE